MSSQRLRRRALPVIVGLIIISCIHITFDSYLSVQQERLYLYLAKDLFLKKHELYLAHKILTLTNYHSSTNQAEQNFLLGRIYFVQNKLPESAISYSKTIEINPSFEQAYYGLGLTYGYSGELYYDLAAKNFQTYLDIIDQKLKDGRYQTPPSGHWAGYNDLAWIYFLQGNYTEAERVTTEALSKYNNPWLFNMMGAVLLNQNRKLEAQTYFQRAKDYAENITSEDFGEAYTGDSTVWHEKGFVNMKQIIQENIEKSSK